MNQFLKISLVLYVGILVSACQSGMVTSGKEHALVVKKWRELSKYVNKSASHNPFIIVGKLSVVKDHTGQKFMLTDIHLTENETKLELNLIYPTFEGKYICTPVCSQLTEYLEDNKSNSTMLSRYFEQHEFELFKFYGDLVSLNDRLSGLISIYPVATTKYFQWLSLKQTEFQSLSNFTEFLENSLTKDNLISFLNDPEKLYLNILTNSQDRFEQLSIWGQDNKLVGSETIRLAMEQSNWSREETADERMIIGQSIKQNLNFKSRLSLQNEPLAIGDQVCSFELNEFGVVSEIIGSRVEVKIVGMLVIVEDGKLVPGNPGDIFNKQAQHLFVSSPKEQIYNIAELAPCDIN